MNNERKVKTGLYILGFGGHARSVADIAMAAGVQELVFVDPAATPGASFAGFPAVTEIPGCLPEGWGILPAIGDNHRRRAACDGVAALATVISPDASIGVAASIGSGTVVARHAHIGPNARVGLGVIVNTGAVVEHDCEVGDFTHVAVNATVAGSCRIGANVMIGAGATVIDGISICDNAVIGAGAVVVGDLTEQGVYVGTPARRIR